MAPSARSNMPARGWMISRIPAKMLRDLLLARRLRKNRDQWSKDSPTRRAALALLRQEQGVLAALDAWWECALPPKRR